MGWTEIPVSADGFITKAPFQEIMDKIRILWDVFPGMISNGGIHPVEPEPLPDEGWGGLQEWYYRIVSTHSRVDVTGYNYWGSGLGWLRRIIEDMHNYVKWSNRSIRFYENGSGDPEKRLIAWVLNEAIGESDWTQITWDTTSSNYRFARGAKLKTAGDCLSEMKTVLDYIKDNAIVYTRTSFVRATYSRLAAVIRIWPDDETTWSGARAHATADAVLMYPEAWYGDFGGYGSIPFVSVKLKHRTTGWNCPHYGQMNNFVQDFTHPVLVEARGATIVRNDSSGWHADLKRSGCKYWLSFKSGSPDWDSLGLYLVTHKHAGMLPLPYTLNGADIEGGAPDNDGNYDAAGRFVPFDYANWDWVNDRGDLLFDDSDWKNVLFIPPDIVLTAWVNVPPTDYFEGDTVTHSMPAGLEWVCIQDNTSDPGGSNEPGTPGGDPYWVIKTHDGWYEGDETYTTGFVWTQVPANTVFVRPDYAGY